METGTGTEVPTGGEQGRCQRKKEEARARAGEMMDYKRVGRWWI
jgi:hypothetical protein